MTKEFIPYEQAVELKELGFDKPCFGYYNSKKEITFNTDGKPVTKDWVWKGNECLPTDMTIAPTYSQTFDWLLDKHHLYGIIIPTVTMAWTFKTMTVVEGLVEVPPYSHVEARDYGTHSEAQLACLNRLIELVKNK